MSRFFALFLLGVASALAVEPDFTGTWNLDKAHSELSGRMNTNAADISQVLRITLTRETFTVATETTGGPLGNVTANDVYPLDGKPHAFTPAARTGSGAAKGTRTTDRNPFKPEIIVEEEITREMPAGPVTVHNTHTWALSDDGRTLTARSVIKGPRGDIPTTRVFLRADASASDKPASPAEKK